MSSRRVGIISDTHGLLRPQAVEALDGCEQIIHAGDVGKPEVLEALGRLAPTVAVRGNVDRGAWATALPDREAVTVAGTSIYVLHDLHELDLDPAAAGVRVVVSGHSHQPHVENRDGVLYLNPGAAGPRRFRLPVTLCHLEIGSDGRLEARLIDLLSTS